MEFQRRSKWWLAGSAAVFLVSGATAFLISSPGSFRPELLKSNTQRGRTGDDTRGPQQAEFSQLEQLQRATIQSEAETEKRLAFLQSAAVRLSPEEYPAAVRATLNWPAREREAFLSAIARRWAAGDAPAACTFFAALEDPDLRITVTGAALEAWASTAAKDALSWLQTQPESTLRTELLERLIRLTQEHDSALALAAFNLLPEKQRDPDRRRRLAVQLAATDARAAVLEILKTDSFKRPDEDALLKIAERCVETDLSGTLAWLKTLDGRSNLFARPLYRAWGRVDPHAALEWIKRSDSGWSLSFAADAVAGWTEKDPVSARAYITALPLGQEREVLMDTLIRKLGVERKDIATFIELCRERTPAAERKLQKDLPDLVRYSGFEYRTVAEGLRDLPQDDHNRELLDGFLASWSEKDPAAAAEYMGTNGLAAKNPLAAAAVTKALAGLDPERAISWAMQLPASEARENAVTAALQQLAVTDAARAWSLCEANLPLPRQRDVAASVAGAWADRDPASAAEWAGSLPDQTARANAFKSIANTWARGNAEGCAAWLGTLEAGPLRDDAIQGYVSRATWQDPHSALTWAASIGDAEQRLKQLTEVADHWRGQNFREADRWIANTDLLSPATKQWLLSTHYAE